MPNAATRGSPDAYERNVTELEAVMSDCSNRLFPDVASAVGAAIAVTTGSVAAFAWAKGRSVRSQALFALLSASRRRKK